jgi:hypothetical protein
MSKRFAISIGVAQAGPLPLLQGARADAEGFANWSENHGYQTTLIIDDRIQITAEYLKKEVYAILGNDIDRLLLFFSGHGIFGHTGDYWLLSNYANESDEAVNVALSLLNARRLPIRQLAIFADACRAPFRASPFVGGRSLFPSVTNRSRKAPQCDEFFSTDVGEVSQEVLPTSSTAGYGVFASCLLAALNGNEPRAFEERTPLKLITSQSLANWLDEEVPFRSGMLAGGVVQIPSTTAAWRRPDDYYVSVPLAGDASTPGIRASDQAAAQHLRWLVDSLWADAISAAFIPMRWTRSALSRRKLSILRQERATAIEREQTSFFAAQEEANHSGSIGELMISGSKVEKAVSGSSNRIFVRELGDFQYISVEGGAQTVGMRFTGGVWTVALILPDCIGASKVRDGLVESLNYQQLQTEETGTANRRLIEILAAWTANLQVGVSVPRSMSDDWCAEVELLNYANFVLDILVGYAHEEAGRHCELERLAQRMGERFGYVPFDVAYLAFGEDWRTKVEQISGISRGVGHITGAFPVMTKGWAMLNPEVGGFTPELLRLRSGLRKSVWTSLEAGQGNQLAELIAGGML